VLAEREIAACNQSLRLRARARDANTEKGLRTVLVNRFHCGLRPPGPGLIKHGRARRDVLGGNRLAGTRDHRRLAAAVSGHQHHTRAPEGKPKIFEGIAEGRFLPKQVAAEKLESDNPPLRHRGVIRRDQARARCIDAHVWPRDVDQQAELDRVGRGPLDDNRLRPEVNGIALSQLGPLDSPAVDPQTVAALTIGDRHSVAVTLECGMTPGNPLWSG